jgi:hypothetical protein
LMLIEPISIAKVGQAKRVSEILAGASALRHIPRPSQTCSAAPRDVNEEHVFCA